MRTLDMNTNGFSSEEIIELRKTLTKQLKDARSSAKHDKCILCGEQRGFCNSHTIPQFCLKNIAWNGKINSMYSLLDTDMLDGESGIQNAGTFHIICRECDATVFQDYENPDVYTLAPTTKMLNQITLKNSLRDIYKHETEIEMFKGMKSLMHEKEPLLSGFVDRLFDAQINSRKMDVQECYDIFELAKNNLNQEAAYLELVSFDMLDYVVPVAFQGMIPLVTGVNNEVINNNYEMDKKYRIQYINLAIFPLKGKTAIIIFIDRSNLRYKEFCEYLRTSSLEERLRVINQIIFLYTEDYFLSQQLPDEITKQLEGIAKTLQDTVTVTPIRSVKNAVKDYDLKRDISIPNILLKDYAVVGQQ